MSRLVEEFVSQNQNKAYATLAKISKACEYNYMIDGIEKLGRRNMSYERIREPVHDCSPVYFTTIFRDLLQNGGNIDYQIPADSSVKLHTPEILGYTGLHFAVSRENDAALSALLELGADTTMQSFDGFTALRLVCEHSYKKRGCKCFKLRGTIEHPLADLLLDAQVKARATANPRCQAGISHLHIACMVDHARAAEFLIENGANVSERVSSDSEVLPGYTPLHFAARYCSVDAIKILLAHGADRSEKEAKGSTPLQLVLDYKMRIGALSQEQLEENDWLRTNLQKVELALQLLTSNADSPRVLFDDKGLTRFHLDCTDANVAVNENSLGDVNATIDLDSPVCPGYTPLHFAACFNLRTFVALLELGADISAKDANGVTPLDICVRKFGAHGLREVLTSRANSLANVRFCNGDKLVDVIASETTFFKYVKTVNDKNVRISADSPVWPGYNLLHVAVHLAKFPSDEKIFYEVDNWQVDPRVLACFCNRVDAFAQDSDGASPLHLAFRQRKEAIIREISYCSRSDASDPVDRHGLSDLHIMAYYGFVPHYYPVHSLSPTHTNRQLRSEISYRGYRFAVGSTALHIATTFGKEKTVAFLLANGADPSIKNAEGLNSAHMSASESSSLAEVFVVDSKFLQENSIADGGLSNLHVACCTSNLAAIESLVNLGADMNLPITRKYLKYATDLQIGYTPLHVAVVRGTIEVVKFLIGHGANIAARSKTELSPVLLAMQMNSYDYKCRHLIQEEPTVILRYFWNILRDRDAEYTEDKTGLTLLHIACSCIDIEMVKDMIKRGLNVNARISEGSPALAGCTPLHVLVQTRYKNRQNWEKAITIARLLLEHGADVTIVNAECETPAHVSYSKVGESDNLLLEVLLERQKSYKINPINRKGISHLHLACLADKPDIVEAFLRGGADANIAVDYFTDKDAGYTPLHYAMKQSQKNLIEILVKYGADVNAEDAIGATPLHMESRHQEIAEAASLEALLRCDKINVNVTTIFGKRPLESVFVWYWGEVGSKTLKLCLSQGGLVNVFNPVTSVGLLGTLVKIRGRRTLLDMLNVILEEASDLDAVCPVTGRNAVHNVVSVRPSMINENYELAIGELIRRGIELDLQDKNGKTPLYVAVEFGSVAGVQVLLSLGADVNITDLGGRTAFEKCCELSIDNNIDISLLFVNHVHKLILLGLEVSDANRRLFDRLREFCRDTLDSHSLNMAKQLMKQIHVIDDGSLTLREFLTEAALMNYPTMPRKKREAIDEFVRTKGELYSRNEMGYLVNLQYRKAKKRVKMVEAVKEVVDMLAGCPMPEPCTENLLRFLRNSDLDTLMKLL